MRAQARERVPSNRVQPHLAANRRQSSDGHRTRTSLACRNHPDGVAAASAAVGVGACAQMCVHLRFPAHLNSSRGLGPAGHRDHAKQGTSPGDPHALGYGCACEMLLARRVGSADHGAYGRPTALAPPNRALDLSTRVVWSTCDRSWRSDLLMDVCGCQ